MIASKICKWNRLPVFDCRSLLDDLIANYDPAPEEALRIAFQKSLPNIDTAHFLPPIKRCLKDSPYLRTSGTFFLCFAYYITLHITNYLLNVKSLVLQGLGSIRLDTVSCRIHSRPTVDSQRYEIFNHCRNANCFHM